MKYAKQLKCLYYIGKLSKCLYYAKKALCFVALVITVIFGLTLFTGVKCKCKTLKGII